MTATSGAKALLISVGGAIEPVLYVLRHYRPLHVWYFCSAGSREKADEIQAQLDWHPQARFIEVDQFEELGPCYQELRRKIPDVLRETHVNPSEVVVDYTGGTKTMSAALVLAAVELFQQFNYVGGTQRGKQGLGITINGAERTVYQTNPWNELAIREVERARDLWDGCQYGAAATILHQIAERMAHKHRFDAVARLADAMAARHRLDFRAAARKLAPLQKEVPPLFDGLDDHGLLKFVKEAHAICQECNSKEANDTFLRELLDNTARTAKQGRYEDAAARLYRAMEMQGQLWLTDATNGLFVNGRCKETNVNNLPVPLQALPFCKMDNMDGIKLSMEQVFRALAALGRDPALRIVADLDAKASDGKTKSRWRAATEKRNASILAHGVAPIGKDGYEDMARLASEFLGFDPTHEHNPILPLDPLWFLGK